MDATAAQTRPAKVARSAAPDKSEGSAAAEVGEAARVSNVGQVSPEKAVLREFANNAWFAVAPAGAAPEDLDMVDGPFNLIAKDLTRCDDIRVICPEGTWLADYVAVDVGPTFALCRLTQAINLPARRADQTDRVPAGFKIVQSGPKDTQQGWLAWRTADNVLLNAGHSFHRREDLIRFVLDHPSVRGNNRPTIFGKPSTS